MMEIIGWGFIVMVIVFLLGTIYSIANNLVFRNINEDYTDEAFDEE